VTARLLALYETPAAPETFDRHYREVHIPLGSRLPGLRRYTVSRDAAAVRGAPYYLVAELEWDTMEDLRAAFASPEGRATAADAARLAELAPVRSMIFTADDNAVHRDTSSSAPVSNPVPADMMAGRSGPDTGAGQRGGPRTSAGLVTRPSAWGGPIGLICSLTRGVGCP
jgi:uncharacterized protein (TIGR02118 family)